MLSDQGATALVINAVTLVSMLILRWPDFGFWPSSWGVSGTVGVSR